MENGHFDEKDEEILKYATAGVGGGLSGQARAEALVSKFLDQYIAGLINKSTINQYAKQEGLDPQEFEEMLVAAKMEKCKEGNSR